MEAIKSNRGINAPEGAPFIHISSLCDVYLRLPLLLLATAALWGGPASLDTPLHPLCDVFGVTGTAGGLRLVDNHPASWLDELVLDQPLQPVLQCRGLLSL